MADDTTPDIHALRIDRPRGDYARAAGPWTRLGLGALVVAGLAWVVHRGGGPAALAQGDGVPVRVRRVARGSSPGAVQGMAANGHVVAARRAALSADTPGRIVELNVTEGSQVTQGQVVARLYSDEVAAALRGAEAGVLEAEAGLARARLEVLAQETELARLEAALAAPRAATRAQAAELELADQEKQRVERLAGQGAAEERELDRVRSAYRAAQARKQQLEALEGEARAAVASGRARRALAGGGVGVAEANLERARAAVAQARATLEKTEVRAPFAGTVVLKDAEVGEVVSPNVVGGASSRGAIVTMVDRASLEVQAEVPETSLAAVRPGGAVKVFLDADPETPLEGTVSRIWPTANRQKATVEVRITVADPASLVRPDMGVRAVFLPAGVAPGQAAADPNRIEVPEACLVRRDGRTGVFLVEGQTARFREVTARPALSGRVPVVGDLEDGDRAILAPPEDLQDGDRVRVEEG